MKTEVYEEKSQTRSKENYQSGSAPRQQQGQGDKQEMMKKVEAAGRPGPQHKALESLAGNWKAEVKCWMDPSGSPEVTKGTAKASTIFNGRFLEEEFHGEM